jgi:thiamine biosynthesis lipoprotein
MKTIHLIPTLAFLFIFSACKQTPKSYETNISIETMGTFGQITIVSERKIDDIALKAQIDSLLILVNQNFSTYIDNSEISKLNNIDTDSLILNAEFELLLKQAILYNQESKGTFNAKVMPLISYYGFAKEEGTSEIDSAYIDSITQLVNQDLLNDFEIKTSGYLVKKRPFQLDFSAFAKGYGVDVVANYLSSLGYENFLVEIGGEVVAKGKNIDGNLWRLGVEAPNVEEREIFEVVQLDNKAMATSGNYRNFKVLENGQKVVHIVNPITGYNESSNLLSASIFASNCMDADAYATACMVMGVDTCFQFILNHPELECYLIYADENGVLKTKSSEGFQKMILESTN